MYSYWKLDLPSDYEIMLFLQYIALDSLGQSSYVQLSSSYLGARGNVSSTKVQQDV